MKYKSIYGRELQLRDTILYWYEVEGTLKYCIARVQNIHTNDIRVDRMLERWLGNTWKYTTGKSKLTNPNFLVVGTEVETPLTIEE